MLHDRVVNQVGPYSQTGGGTLVSEELYAQTNHRRRLKRSGFTESPPTTRLSAFFKGGRRSTRSFHGVPRASADERLRRTRIQERNTPEGGSSSAAMSTDLGRVRFMINGDNTTNKTRSLLGKQRFGRINRVRSRHRPHRRIMVRRNMCRRRRERRGDRTQRMVGRRNGQDLGCMIGRNMSGVRRKGWETLRRGRIRRRKAFMGRRMNLVHCTPSRRQRGRRAKRRQTSTTGWRVDAKTQHMTNPLQS